MRGEDQKQTAMYSYVTLTQRIPAQHPARQLRALADRALARLYKKSKADKSVPAYMGHTLIENRNGLAVAAEASNAAEREAALSMLDRTVAPQPERKAELVITLGADTLYQEEKFIEALRDREVAPHVSECTQQSSNLGKNSLSEAERTDPRRSISQKKRKLGL